MGLPTESQLRQELAGAWDLLDAERRANAVLRKDAERYRWLRSTTNWASSNGERVDVRNNPELWDEAIDACISKTAAFGDA